MALKDDIISWVERNRENGSENGKRIERDAVRPINIAGAKARASG